MQSLEKEQGLTVEWLQTHHMYRILYKTAKRFGKKFKNDPDITKLGLIQSEIWMARQTLQPFPHISVAKDKSEIIVGAMCGFPYFNQFFIQYIAICPDFSHIQDEIEKKLISSAIDKSIELGFRGWVACSPEPSEEKFWHSHRFCKESEGMFRRMGYFVGI